MYRATSHIKRFQEYFNHIHIFILCLPKIYRYRKPNGFNFKPQDVGQNFTTLRTLLLHACLPATKTFNSRLTTLDRIIFKNRKMIRKIDFWIHVLSCSVILFATFVQAGPVKEQEAEERSK